MSAAFSSQAPFTPNSVPIAASSFPTAQVDQSSVLPSHLTEYSGLGASQLFTQPNSQMQLIQQSTMVFPVQQQPTQPQIAPVAPHHQMMSGVQLVFPQQSLGVASSMPLGISTPPGVPVMAGIASQVPVSDAVIQPSINSYPEGPLNPAAPQNVAVVPMMSNVPGPGIVPRVAGVPLKIVAAAAPTLFGTVPACDALGKGEIPQVGGDLRVGFDATIKTGGVGPSSSEERAAAAAAAAHIPLATCSSAVPADPNAPPPAFVAPNTAPVGPMPLAPVHAPMPQTLLAAAPQYPVVVSHFGTSASVPGAGAVSALPVSSSSGPPLGRDSEANRRSLPAAERDANAASSPRLPEEEVSGGAAQPPAGPAPPRKVDGTKGPLAELTHQPIVVSALPETVSSVTMEVAPLQTPTATPKQPQQQQPQQQQQQQVGEAQYTPLHNSLYLHLARILRPVWSTPLVKEEIQDTKTVVSR